MDLIRLRKEIDKIDSSILRLIQKRFEKVHLIKKFKSEIEDSEREKRIIERLMTIKTDEIQDNFIKALYSLILSESKRVQNANIPIMGFYGEHGAYSEIAIKRWNKEAIPIPCRSLKELCDGLRLGIYDYCIFPIFNTTSGPVRETSHIIKKNNFKIKHELLLPINHCLLSLPQVGFKNIKRVMSHPHALTQCREFINKRGFSTARYWDTAGSARLLAEKGISDTGVIASSICARLYELKILKENIETREDNATLFVIVSRAD